MFLINLSHRRKRCESDGFTHRCSKICRDHLAWKTCCGLMWEHLSGCTAQHQKATKIRISSKIMGENPGFNQFYPCNNLESSQKILLLLKSEIISPSFALFSDNIDNNLARKTENFVFRRNPPNDDRQCLKRQKYRSHIILVVLILYNIFVILHHLSRNPTDDLG